MNRTILHILKERRQSCMTILISEKIKFLIKNGRFSEMKNYRQHKNYSTYDHSVSVAEKSLILVDKFHINVDKDELITAALLHDYYLYDWHNFSDGTHRLHGFRHGKTACNNAVRDYHINKRQQQAIRNHMFPLTPPPTTKMGIVITIADKICSCKEVFKKRPVLVL